MTKKNYIQTLKSHEPNRYFNFSDSNNYIYYDNNNVEGGFYDNLNDIILSPVFTYANKPPSDVPILGPSVISNEKSNNSLILATSGLDRLYNIYYETPYINNIDEGKHPYESSFTMQFRIPEQITRKKVIVNISRPYAKVTDSVTKQVYYYYTCAIFDNKWYLEINDLFAHDIKSFDIEIYYLGDIIHDDSYTIDDDKNKILTKEKKNIYFNINTRLNYSDKMLHEELDKKAKFTRVFSFDVEAGDNLLAYDGRSVYPCEDNVIFMPTNQTIMFSGVIYQHPTITKISQNRYDDTLVEYQQSDKTILAHVGDMMVYLDYFKRLRIIFNKKDKEIIYDINHPPLDINKNYNLFVTIQPTGSYDIQKILVYLNGVVIGSYVSSDVTEIRNLAVTDIQIGTNVTLDKLVSAPYTYFNADYKYTSNSVTCYVDNIATFGKALDADDIYLMYIRTLTYRELLLEFNPDYHIDFTKSTKIYNNRYDSRFLRVHNFNNYLVDTGNEIYPHAVRFMGKGSLINEHSNYWTISTNTRLIDFNKNFSLVFWFKTTTNDMLLFSQREKGKPEHGLSIFIKNGYIFYQYNDINYITECKVNDDKYRMLCIAYNKDENLLTTYVPQEHNSSVKLKLFNYDNQRYVTLLNDKTYIRDVDIYLSAFTYFKKYLTLKEFDYLFNEMVNFTLDGTILYKNLPSLAKVRIIDHETGELLDTKYTNEEGIFKYDSIYKNNVDIIIQTNNEIKRLQALGTFTTNTG